MNRKSVIVGAVLGVVIAAAVVVLTRLAPGENELVESIVHFIASVPGLLIVRLNLSDILSYILLFVYWGAAGACAGWFAGQKGVLSKIILILFLVFLLAGHWHAMVQLERDLDQLTESISRALSQELSKIIL